MSFRRLYQWLRGFAHPDSAPSPPPSPPMTDDTARKRFLDDVHTDIRHRERVLRALEARANVRGGATPDDYDG